MNPTSDLRRELCDLLGRLREGQLEEAGLARLDALVNGDAAARRLYLDYVDLCASLHWAAVEARGMKHGESGLGVGDPRLGVRDSGFRAARVSGP